MQSHYLVSFLMLSVFWNQIIHVGFRVLYVNHAVIDIKSSIEGGIPLKLGKHEIIIYNIHIANILLSKPRLDYEKHRLFWYDFMFW